MYFTSTPHGARLARRLCVTRLNAWGYATDTPALLIGELTANAAAHCPSPQLKFELRITVKAYGSNASHGHATPDTLLIEVSDGCGDHHPVAKAASDDTESGRGMFLVEALATAWDSYNRPQGKGKTVWCRCPLTPLAHPAQGTTSAQGTAPAPLTSPGRATVQPQT